VLHGVSGGGRGGDAAAAANYSGRVFVRLGASGHLMAQHYVEAMFGPLRRANAGPLGAWDGRSAAQLHLEYLDYEVRVAGLREVGLAPGGTQGIVVLLEGSGGVGGAGAGAEVERRVRDVSRLWRYLGGEEGV